MHPSLLPLLLVFACQPTIPRSLDAPGPRGEVSAQPDDSAAPDGPTTPPPPACGLQVEPAAASWMEGETATVAVACAETPDRIHDLDVLGLPDGATWDPTAGAVTWPTDGADAGTATLTFAVPGAGTPETAVVDLPIVDDPGAPGATPPDPLAYVEEWGLPVVHLDVDGPLTPAKRDATITVDGQAYSGSAKLRGATSLAYPKNSFTLDFGEPEVEIDAWDGPSRGHLVLISTFDDNSYVRQKLVYDTWAAMAEAQDAERLTPRTFFTVVYLNGVYHGLYIGCDRVDDEFARHMGFGGDGDLFKAVDHDANYDLVDGEGAPKDDLAMGWEHKEGDDLDDFGLIAALTSFVGHASPDDFAETAHLWLDTDEFIDWWILVTWTLAEDSAGKNHYVYRDEDTGWFRFVPWDFNASYGQSWKTKRYDADVVRDHTDDNRIFEHLSRHPDLSAQVTSRLATLQGDKGPLSAKWQLQKIAEYTAVIDPSARRDQDKWGDEYRSFGRWRELRDSREDWTDYDGELAYVTDWVTHRAAGLGDWPRDLD